MNTKPLLGKKSVETTGHQSIQYSFQHQCFELRETIARGLTEYDAGMAAITSEQAQSYLVARRNQQ